MLTRVLRYLRSQVLGLVAIFIALGGTGYAAISIPQHSIGQRALKSASVGSAQLRKHSVTRAKLAKSSVGTAQLRKGSVTANQIKTGSVTSTKLAAGSVGTSQLAPASVGASQIAAGSVGSGQLAAGSVGSAQIANGSIGNAQLAAGSVGPAQLTGIGGYIQAFAIVDATGRVVASDPAATTSNWANGNGAITFASPVDGTACIPSANAPAGSGTGSSLSFIAEPSGVDGVAVATNPTSGTSQDVIVEIECAV
jgi:hypothetical protein